MSGTLFWLVVLGIGVGVLLWAAKRPSEAELRGWADARDVPLTDRNGALLSDYLRRTRLLRTIGGVVGLLLSQLPAAIDGILPDTTLDYMMRPLSSPLVMIVVGYLVGALVAEYTRPRQTEGRGQRAALVPREWDDYVDRFSRWILRGSLAVSVALVPVAAVVPVLPERTLPSAWDFALRALAILGIILFAEWLQRLIVRRPQPPTAPDLVAADDAARASSIHAVAGTAVVLALTVLAGQLGDIGLATSVRPLRWTLPQLALVAQVGGIGLWLGFGTHYAWVVQRRLVRA